MIRIVTRIVVNAKSSLQISRWMRTLNREKYLQWHQAHKDYKRIKITRSFVGSVIYFDETIEDLRIRFRWEVIELRGNELLIMKARFFYPIYLQLSLKEINGNTEVLHELRIGFELCGVEKIFDALISLFVFTNKRAKALDRHATEEFGNLERLIV